MPLENVPDAAVATDSGEIAAVTPVILIETQPEAVTLTEAPETTFLRSPVGLGRTLMIGEMKLETSLFLAAKGIRHPTRNYRGKVKSFGSVIRQIPVPAGLPQISDAVVEIIDTDGSLRQAFAETPPNNREMVLKIGDEGQSESLFQTVYTGIITPGTTFPPGLVRVTLKDITSQFLMEQLPNLLTRENFVADPLFAKNLRGRTEGRFEEREVFAPIIFGNVSSDGLDTDGAMNAVRLDSTTFNLAQHSIPHASVKLFEKLPTDQSFVQLLGGFSIVEVNKTIDGIPYTFTQAVFGAAKPDQYELRFDSDGLTDDGTKDGTVVRDPAECIRLYLIRIARRGELTEIDTAGFAVAGAAMAAVATGGPVPGLFCDGAVTQRMSHREVLGRMLQSFGLFLFSDKSGKLTLRFINQSDPDRPVLTDLDRIYLKSEIHSLARPVFNEILVQYNRTFSDQNWNANLTITDDDSVTALGKVEKADRKLFFVRDDFVADSVGRSFLQFVSPGSFRIVLTTPGHLTNDFVELAKLVGVTSYSGPEVGGGGYDNKEFLISKIEFRTDSKQLRVHAVARAVPPVLGLTLSTSLEFFTVEAAAGLFVNGLWLELTGRPPVDSGFNNPVVLPFKPKWITIEVANGFGGFPGLNVPTEARLDFGKGVPGFEEVVLEDISIFTDQTGVDANSSRQYSFPYEGWAAGDRVFVRARDNLVEASVRHLWNGDITFWR